MLFHISVCVCVHVCMYYIYIYIYIRHTLSYMYIDMQAGKGVCIKQRCVRSYVFVYMLTYIGLAQRQSGVIPRM
jgi:hypothetical protein